MGDLLSKYTNSLRYFKTNAVVMREFTGICGKLIPVGTIIYVKKISSNETFFYTVESDDPVTRLSSINDYSCIFLYDLKNIASIYSRSKLSRNSPNNTERYYYYLNHRREFTDLKGEKHG